MERPTTSQGIPPSTACIYETLFSFMDDVLFKYKPSTKKQGEDLITQDIEISLNEETRVNDTCFAFQNQYKEGRATTDIGVYIRSNRCFFCWVEAKRLPTPTGAKRDEREYVFVDKDTFEGNGGIKRFKENEHAKGRYHSIMIGYIQDDNTADYWLSRINQWITELSTVDRDFWSGDDHLNKHVSHKCNRFSSVHKRRDKTSITLHHYWLVL